MPQKWQATIERQWNKNQRKMTFCFCTRLTFFLSLSSSQSIESSAGALVRRAAHREICCKIGYFKKNLKVKSWKVKKLRNIIKVWGSFFTFFLRCLEHTQNWPSAHCFFQKIPKKSFFNREKCGVQLRNSKFLPKEQIRARSEYEEL